MKRLTLIVAVLAIVAAACGSSSDPETTTTSTSQPGASDTTTSTAIAEDTTTTTTEAPVETSTTLEEASGDLASCVVGVWALDSQPFFEAIQDALDDATGGGEFNFVGGSYTLTVGADGTFIDERKDWSFEGSTDFGDVQIVVNDRNEGTYTLEGDVLSTTIDMGEPAEITILLDGVPFETPGGVSPITPPDASFTGATVTCTSDLLTATFEGSTSSWTRVG